MIDIFIKSFNRPYYLDKCLDSIYKHCQKQTFNIIILDDGTPARYLDKITRRYPEVRIIRSPFYEHKIQLIEEHVKNTATKVTGLTIPASFWLSEILKSQGDYFLLLEDDIWLTRDLDIDATIAVMRQEKIALLKCANYGNEYFVDGKVKNVTDEICTIIPNIKIKSPFLYKEVMMNNRLKSLSVLYRLKAINTRDFSSYYMIYYVAGAFYNKYYYEYLWSGFEGTVNEKEQILNVLKYRKKYPDHKYGFLKQDVINTSFTSSATNMFEGINLDVFVFNYILNEAWENDYISVYGKNEIDEKVITAVLKQANHPLATTAEWKKWIERFTDQYKKAGYIL